MLLIFAFFSELSFQKANIILVYHSVGSNRSFYNVELEDFIRQIEYLKKKYSIVSLDDIVSFVRNGKETSGKLVTITFDDGYQDFYLNIYGYLRKNKLPAIVFVATGYVGKEWPFGEDQLKMLKWNEIEEISKNNIEIGAHTVTHPNLQELELKEAEKEILKSKEQIEKHIKRRVKYFSFPFGRYSQKIIDKARDLGFEAVLCGEGTVQKELNPFVLKRIQIDSSTSFLLFKAKLTRAIDWYNTFERIMKEFLRTLNLIK